MGNCGSPIETEAGWLVLSHGVGAMRKYCIGAFLLDRENPAKVLGRLREPLLKPIEHERAGRLWEAIDALPEKLRVVVVLAGIEEYDLQEVARLLDVPLGTVKSRMFAARAQMREHLQCTMNSQQR